MNFLSELQTIPGPSGDEGRIADYLEAHCARLPGVTVRRYGDLVLAQKGRPRVAIFAHTDTVGFTQGYGRDLLAVGGPRPENGDLLREVGGTAEVRIKVRESEHGPTWKLAEKAGRPGSRWVYAAPLKAKKRRVIGPYLDNRAGVWNAVRCLERCADVAVVFTPGEEHSGRGALMGARIVYQDLQITRALISDITWHTRGIKNGQGPAISFRDRSIPRQRFLDAVLAAATESGVPFQREVESSGGSDGSQIERSTFPIDWVFVGAPQKRSHTTREECEIADLHAMSDLYAALVPALSR
jgi:putative aminopeptidase FrvX